MPPIAPLEIHVILLIAAAGFMAGTLNALAGGGSFITFPALLMAGLNPLAANITSTVALFPSQITSAVGGRSLVADVGPLSFRQMFIISVLGGVLGAVLLLHTPPTFFARVVPWLIMFATAVFAWGSFRHKPLHAVSGIPLPVLVAVQTCIAIYGGYFGGGIGFLMLAALTVAGMQLRAGAATKNMLAMAMNASATLIFASSSLVRWPVALALCAGSIGGGLCGAWLIHRLPERVMRAFVVLVGSTLTVWMFVHQA